MLSVFPILGVFGDKSDVRFNKGFSLPCQHMLISLIFVVVSAPLDAFLFWFSLFVNAKPIELERQLFYC